MKLRMECLTILPLILGFAVVTQACTPRTNEAVEQSFNDLLQIDDVNISLSMRIIGESKEFGAGDSIDFSLENVSSETILFPPDFGAKGFYYDSEQAGWVQLENLISYYPEMDRILGPKGGDLTSHDIVGFNPDEEGIDLPIQLRVVVFGYVYREGEVTDEAVAAYADATITE